MIRKKAWCKFPWKKIRVVYYWGKVLGINPLTLSKKKQLHYSYCGLLYGCFLTILYCIMYYRLMVRRFSTLLLGLTPIATIVDFLSCTWQFLETASTFFLFAIKQQRVKTIVKSFVMVEKTSEKLGISDDWDKQFKECGVWLILCNIGFLITFIITHMLLSYYDVTDPFLLISFDLPTIAPFNAMVMFMWCFILVCRKFRRLNETVEFLMNDKNAEKSDEECDESSRSMREFGCDSDLLDRINIISQLHRELRDIVTHLEKNFASLILFSVGNSFAWLTFIFSLHRYTEKTKRGVGDLLFLALVNHWLLYCIVALIVISSVCGSTSNEANKTGGKFHKALSRNEHLRDSQENLKLNLLSLDLLQNRVSISVYGLYELDEYLFFSIITTMVTYLLLMLQLYYE